MGSVTFVNVTLLDGVSSVNVTLQDRVSYFNYYQLLQLLSPYWMGSVTSVNVNLSYLLLLYSELQVVHLNDAKILHADLPALNGYIHIIDTVCYFIRSSYMCSV